MFEAIKRFSKAYGLNTRPQNIIGSGPYRVKEFQAGKLTLLERNPEYWVADKRGRRLPYFDEVMVKVQPGFGSEANAALASLLTAGGDACDNVLPAAVARFKEAVGTGKFRVHELGVGVHGDPF